jgi:hypothetical protein
VPLIKSQETKKVGSRAGASNGATKVPCNGNDIITHGVGSSFLIMATMGMAGDDILM